jgi:polysaccharide export outer membrane protein
MRRLSRLSWKAIIALGALIPLAGCSTIPNSGPSASDVIHQASNDSLPRYEFVDLTSGVTALLEQRAPPSLFAHFGDYRMTGEPRIGIGDSISVTIWEASSGGLFSAPLLDKVSTGSNSATIPEQIVGRDGAITVPYAGRVPVAGRTTREVQTVVEKALEGKAIQPQVLINVTHSLSNSVSVGGEVSTGARIPLSVKGDRLLDVIAAAGGVRAPVNETFVELSRGNKTTRVALVRVIADPKENIYLRPNDVLTLVREPQTFIAYGATGRNAEIPFEADGISLAQALSKAGGLLDERSDPQGVFVFRYEPENIARELNPASPLVARGQQTPVVYRLDLRDANSLFVEQKFRVMNRDVIYVSNAPLTEVTKIMQIFNTAAANAGSAAAIATTVK